MRLQQLVCVKPVLVPKNSSRFAALQVQVHSYCRARLLAQWTTGRKDSVSHSVACIASAFNDVELQALGSLETSSQA